MLAAFLLAGRSAGLIAVGVAVLVPGLAAASGRTPWLPGGTRQGAGLLSVAGVAVAMIGLVELTAPEPAGTITNAVGALAAPRTDDAAAPQRPAVVPGADAAPVTREPAAAAFGGNPSGARLAASISDLGGAAAPGSSGDSVAAAVARLFSPLATTPGTRSTAATAAVFRQLGTVAPPPGPPSLFAPPVPTTGGTPLAAAGQPPVTDPLPAGPPPADPTAGQPQVTEPSASQPPPTDPPVTTPTAPPPAAPPAADPTPTDPPVTAPPVSDPPPADPTPADPPVSAPPASDPTPTDPPVSQPTPTDPAATEPAPTTAG